jgi:hypothetical protein
MELSNMSAVLPSPTLPMLTAIEERFKAMEERIKSLENENTEIKADLLETKELLASSLKRNTQLENAIFAKDFDGEILRDEDYKPILNITKAPESPIEVLPPIDITTPTTLDMKAREVVEHLKTNVKERHGAVYMDTKEFYNFMETRISEELKMKPTIRNRRQAKKDILTRAVEKYPDLVFIVKSKYGNRVTGIALKPSAKCRDTDTC